MRSLYALALDPAADHAAAGSDGEIHSCTLDLRIASIFVILFGASVFGLLTLRFKSADAVFPRLLRAFSGGIILALALVHIIPEAVADLNSLMHFPIGGCTILFGIISLVVIDSALAAIMAPDSYKQHILEETSGHQQQQQHGHHHGKSSSSHAHSHSHSNHEDHSHGHHSHSHDTHSSSHNGSSHKHAHQQPHKATAAAAAAAADQEAAAAVVVQDVDLIKQQQQQQDDAAADADAAARSSVNQPHGHQCLRSINASGWISSAAAPMRDLRQCVTAYTMELGCIFHSVIIGVGVGVVTQDRQLVTTLMIALAIHQGLEALALGSVLALTSFSLPKKVVMLLLYSMTTPIGIAVGIAISSSYDPESTTSRAVQGTLNGVSGGMLLYIAMFQLIAEEFSREDMLVRPGLRLGMYGALCAGAAVMCILGIWS
uniref:Zinc/iron permease n=1 Tax=Tetradesmus obliquus TaxID=3088 RepID=A0A383V3N2_TETOB|eukprot:jgi/Sobl393_1/14352/SZX60217.1